MVEAAETSGWVVRLWALDRVAPTLAQHTVGVSAGAKFPLLNELVRDQELDRFDWVVVADDDVAFRSASPGEVLARAESAGLDLVQPAHTELSHGGHEIVMRHALSVARRTTFVEIGPVFAIRQPWVSQVLPSAPEHRMGWGLELEWFDLARRGARLGIVDTTPIRHLEPPGKMYASADEYTRLRDRLRARGLGSLQDIQQTVGTWRPWRPHPPWGRVHGASR